LSVAKILAAHRPVGGVLLAFGRGQLAGPAGAELADLGATAVQVGLERIDVVLSRGGVGVGGLERGGRVPLLTFGGL
jgi:hypothetical protein